MDLQGQHLVSTEWLAAHLDEPDLRIFDTTVHLLPATRGPYRIESGRADYDKAHIPGAAFLDLSRDLSDQQASLPFTKPSHDLLLEAFGQAGVGPTTAVIVYSSSTPMWATRVWWMLRAAGFENVAVLDGGLGKWMAAQHPVEQKENVYPAASLQTNENQNAWADKKAVLGAIDDEAICTINALSPGVFSGTSETSYGRKGHITGSRNVPYAALLNEDGTYRAPQELTALFKPTGVFGKSHAICYCGGGIAATMDALALTMLGHPSVAIYDGSMSEWCSDETLPMTMGDD